jgi:hypothetical protein
VKRRLIKLLIFFVVVTLLPSCSRVTPIKIQDQPRHITLPPSSLFEPGDIVLTISNDPTSWMLSLLGNPEPEGVRQAYTHGEVVFINKEGTKMLGGFSGQVMSQPLIERLPLFQKLVVLRPRRPARVRYKLAAKMAQLTHTSHYKKARFDYSFRDIPGRTDKFYCLGLINEVYRQVDEPVPFPHQPLPKNNLIRHAESMIGYELPDGPVVQDIVENPDFQVVLEWSNNRYGDSDALFNEHIARYALDVYDQGWQLRPSDELAVSMLLWFADDASFDLFKKTIRTFENFSGEVAIDWYKFQLKGEFDSLDDEAKINALKQFASRYRDEYFLKNSHLGAIVAAGR